MPHPIHRRYSIAIAGFILATIAVGCQRNQTVSITAEDFRFTPGLVRVKGSEAIRLTIYNGGREIHEFDSPLLIYASQDNASKPFKSSTGSGILLSPGQSFHVVVIPPPGTYLYICRRKGHANMTGTLIVE